MFTIIILSKQGENKMKKDLLKMFKFLNLEYKKDYNYKGKIVRFYKEFVLVDGVAL